MRAFVVEVTAKVFVRSQADPDDLAADLYCRIVEFCNDEDILDLEVHAVPLPADLSGQAPH